MTSDEKSGSLLVLERVERVPDKPHQLAGTVRFGGHRFRVVIEADPRFLGLISTVEAPQLLKVHALSHSAVVRAMGGILDGNEVPLPLDLTEKILHPDAPHPFVPLDPAYEARLEAAADAIDVRLERVEWPAAGVDPPLVRAAVVVDGVPMTVKVWLYAAPGAVTKVLWIGKHDPDPSPEQATAIERVLLAHRPPANVQGG
jgi:hypothetical protein